MADDMITQFNNPMLNLEQSRSTPSENHIQEAAERRLAAGRFTLEEAATTVVHGQACQGDRNSRLLHWKLDWPLLNKLIKSAQDGGLLLYSPEGFTIPPDTAPTVEWFARETYWKDLNAWLSENEPNVSFRFYPPAASAASAAFGRSEARSEKNEYPDDSGQGLGRRERQIRRILWAVEQLGYPAMSIPSGGKAKLREFCRKTFPELLQSKDSFDGAWKTACGQKIGFVRLRMADHQKFTSKGR